MTGAPPERSPVRLRWALAAVALVVYAADQITKALAVQHLTPGTSVGLLGPFVDLRLIRNPGAAFSLATGVTWVLTLVAAVVVVAVLRTSRRLGSRGWALALGLLLGGTLGNLTDRVVRAPGIGHGHVVDFLDYGGLFVGNVADIAIVAAAIVVAALGLRGIGLDGVRATRG